MHLGSSLKKVTTLQAQNNNINNINNINNCDKNVFSHDELKMMAIQI